MTREEMIIANIGLACKIAKRFSDTEDSRYTYDEYLSVCYEALIKAVDKYNPDLNIKFSTFATKCCINAVYKMYNCDKWYNYRIGEQLDKQHGSLNVSYSDGENKDMELVQLIEDYNPVQYDKFWVKEFIREVVRECFPDELMDRNLIIIEQRIYNGTTYDDISKVFGISKQHCQRIMIKFRNYAKELIKKY